VTNKLLTIGEAIINHFEKELAKGNGKGKTMKDLAEEKFLKPIREMKGNPLAIKYIRKYIVKEVQKLLNGEEHGS
jgi:hypothetical protein